MNTESDLMKAMIHLAKTRIQAWQEMQLHGSTKYIVNKYESLVEAWQEMIEPCQMVGWDHDEFHYAQIEGEKLALNTK
jgi:hypothetical protein